MRRVLRGAAAITDAISSSASHVHAHACLRLRVTGTSELSATQAAVALHGWRVRRGLGDGPAASAFRASDLLRDAHRVELVLPGDVATLTSLFGRA